MAELPNVDPDNIENFSKPLTKDRRKKLSESIVVCLQEASYNDAIETRNHDGICDSRIEVQELNGGGHRYIVQFRDPRTIDDYYITLVFSSIALVIISFGIGLFFLRRFIFSFRWKTVSEHDTEELAKAKIDQYILMRTKVVNDRHAKKVKSTKYIKYP